MAIKRIEKDDIVQKGVLDNLTESAKESKAAVELLESSLKAVVELTKQTKQKISVTSPKDVKSVQELNQLTERAAQLAKNKLQVDKEIQKEKIRFQTLNNERNKALKEEIALEGRQLGLEERLLKQNKELRLERKKLVETDKNYESELKRINSQLDKNNATLEATSDKMKKQRLGVGRYKQAVQGLRGALAQLGLAFGVFSILRDSFAIVKDFEQTQADLASVLGVNIDNMAKLTEQAKQLGATTTFTASQVSELQKEFAKLGFTEQEILNTTEATLLLAEATGTDLARAAEVTGSTIRGFGLDASESQRVVDVMAKSFSSSSLDMEKFATAMAAVAPVAKTAGLNIEQTTALLGTLTDRGIDASTAGTSLRNVFLELSKNGITFDEAMTMINESTDKNKTSMELFGKRGATVGVILSETGESVEALTNKLNDADGAAKQMADTQRNTLGGALKLLTSAWEGFILKMNEAGGASDKLRKIVVFLADNLDTILTTVVNVAKAFVTYRTVLFSMKMAERVKEFVSFGKAVKSGDKSVKDATKSVKGFGNTLKAIGWTALIIFATKLASAFYDVATGATEARIAAEELDRIGDSTEQTIQRQIDKRKRLLDTFKGTKEEQAKLIEQQKEENKQQQAALKLSIEKELASQKLYAAYINENKAAINSAQSARELGVPLTSNQKDILAISDAFASSRATALAYADGINQLKREFDFIPEPINNTNEDLEGLNKTIKSSTDELEEYNEEIDKATKKTYSFAEAARAYEATKPKKFEDLDVPDTGIVDVDPEEFKETEEKKYFIQKEYIDLATDYFIKRADERIAKIQEETDAATKQSEYYKQLAANGNITAKESLAEQDQIIAESNAKKEQEEQRKQRILLISSVLQAFNSNLESGDSSGEALTKAITSTTLVSQFINALPAFEDGTENTSLHGAGKNIDGRGGFHAVLHQNERVLTSEQNDKIGDYSNNEVAAIMEKHRLGQLTSDTQIMVGFGSEMLVNQLMNVEAKLDQVTKAIQDKPVPNLEMGEITQSYMTIKKRIETPKGVTTSKFKVN